MADEKTEQTAAEKLAGNLAGEKGSSSVRTPGEGDAEVRTPDTNSTRVSSDGEEGTQDVSTPDEDPGDATEKPEDQSADADKLTKDDGTPYTRADLDGLQNALKAARKDARTLKTDLDALKAKGGDRPLDEVLAEAESVAEAKWKPLMVRAAARAAFAEAGLALPEGRQDEALARAVRLLDADTLTISDTGAVEGLTEQVEAIRSDFPDLFASTVRRARIQAADRPSSAKPAPSAADRLAAQLTGRAS